MASASFSPHEEDRIVQRFVSGLDAWEKPFEAPAPEKSVRARGARRAATRTRGTVRARGPAPTPPEEDPAVQRFKAGLASWERPFAENR